MNDSTTLQMFEKKYMIYLIMRVKNEPGLTKTELMTVPDKIGNDRTRFIRIQDLIKMGIFEISSEGRQHNTMHIFLTKKGQMIASYFEKIEECMEREI